jgi:class 3 adenylate cyclase
VYRYNLGFLGTRAKACIVTFLIFIILSAVVSLFNSFFNSAEFFEYQAREIEKLFEGRRDFTTLAREVLDTRSDIAYIKLLDKNGIIIDSLGKESFIGLKKFNFPAADENTVIVGIREMGNKKFILHSLLWSVIIGIFFSVISIFTILVFFTRNQNIYLERIINAIKRLSRGDFTARLDIEKALENDVLMIRLFESFNQMVDQLRRREETARETYRFQPTVIVSEKKEEAKLRKVTALVAKISGFEGLSSRLGAAEFSSFLTEYRKAASSIVSDYGGVIEALLQDEIVALFNVPDEQDKPELRAVCAAVEVLQVLANMNKKRVIEGKESINGKIGIGAKAVPFYVESGIPQGVKEVVNLAREISKDAPLWKVLVSSEVYELVSDYVDAKEIDVEHGTSFSIVAVEEGIIQV